MYRLNELNGEGPLSQFPAITHHPLFMAFMGLVQYPVGRLGSECPVTGVDCTTSGVGALWLGR